MISSDKEQQLIYTRGLVQRSIALFVFFIPLFYGSVHYPVLIAEFIFSTILFLSYFYLNREITLNRPSLIFLLFILTTLIITLLQLIPLPLSILKILSPKEFELLSQINSLYSGIIDPIRFYTLSIEPYFNLEYLLRIILLGQLFVIASQDEFSKTNLLLKSVAYCGAIIVIYGFIEGLLNFKSLNVQTIHITNEGILPSVFINLNHQAGFLGLATFSGAALYYSTEDKNERLILLFCAILSGVGIFLTLSRGGIIAFFASLIFLIALLKKDRVVNKRSSLILFISAILILITSFYVAYQEIVSELETLTDIKRMENEKYLLVINSLPLFMDFFLTGVGKGGFEVMFNLYRKDNIFVSFSQMENQLFQQLADYGIFYFLIIIGLISYFAYTFFRHRLDTSIALLVTGVFYILLQNLVDFNLEIFSIQVAFIVIMANLLSRLSYIKDENHLFEKKTFRITDRIYYIFSAIIITIFIAGIVISYSNQRDKIEAETDIALNSGLNPEDPYFLERIKRYPFNYYIPAAIGARYYLDTKRPIVTSYLLHSTLINPVAFEPHYMLYRYFLKKGEKARAQSECRLALRYSRASKERLIYSELLKNIDPDELFKYIPYTPEKITSFAEYLISNSELKLAKEFIEDALYLASKDPMIIRIAFNIYIRLQDIEKAEKALSMYESLEKGYSLYFMKGILSETRGEYEEALANYTQADTLNPLNPDILLKIANLYKKMGMYEEARRHFLKVFLCDNINTDTKINIYSNLADTYLLENNSYEALKYLRTALGIQIKNIALRFKIASICERNGNLSCAINEYKDILIIDPHNETASKKAIEIENRIKELENLKRLEELQK